MNFDTRRSEGQLCGISDKGRHKGWRDWTDTFQVMLSCPYALNIKSSPSPAALNPKALDSWVEGTDSQGGDNRSSPKPLLFIKRACQSKGNPFPSNLHYQGSPLWSHTTVLAQDTTLTQLMGRQELQ